MTQVDDEHPVSEENEIIYLPELLVRNIDQIVKNLKIHRNREEFIATAIENFIAML